MTEEIRFYESTAQAPWNRNQSDELEALGPAAWDRDRWERCGEPEDWNDINEIGPFCPGCGEPLTHGEILSCEQCGLEWDSVAAVLAEGEDPPLDYTPDDDDADAALDAQERQYWATHEVWYDDEDRPHICES